MRAVLAAQIHLDGSPDQFVLWQLGVQRGVGHLIDHLDLPQLVAVARFVARRYGLSPTPHRRDAAADGR